MSWYIVIRQDTGEAYSIGDQIADPMPPEFEAIPLSDADAAAILSGTARWDAATRDVVSG